MALLLTALASMAWVLIAGDLLARALRAVLL